MGQSTEMSPLVSMLFRSDIPTSLEIFNGNFNIMWVHDHVHGTYQTAPIYIDAV